MTPEQLLIDGLREFCCCEELKKAVTNVATCQPCRSIERFNEAKVWQINRNERLNLIRDNAELILELTSTLLSSMRSGNIDSCDDGLNDRYKELPKELIDRLIKEDWE